MCARLDNLRDKNDWHERYRVGCGVGGSVGRDGKVTGAEPGTLEMMSEEELTQFLGQLGELESPCSVRCNSPACSPMNIQ